MAIVKATYTRSRTGAKATVRYIAHRPGKQGAKSSRTLFGIDGALGRWQANSMIDAAQKGSIFFRFVISPDPTTEDTRRDIHLRTITEQTMQTLEERLQQPVQWVATEHDDHAPHRHVHVLAVVKGSVTTQDLQALRQSATYAAGLQRTERDSARAHELQAEEGAEWEW